MDHWLCPMDAAGGLRGARPAVGHPATRWGTITIPLGVPHEALSPAFEDRSP
jgi:hypothetical protein